MDMVVNHMLECLDKLQNDGNTDALAELLLFRPILVRKVNETDPGHYPKIVAAIVGRLEVFDIPTSLELLLIVKHLLKETEIPPGSFVNDTMITTLRYLLSVNSHGVVTCALDFLASLVKRLPLFSILYMKIMNDKLDRITLHERSLDCSIPAQPACTYSLCKVPGSYEEFIRPYRLARGLKIALNPSFD